MQVHVAKSLLAFFSDFFSLAWWTTVYYFSAIKKQETCWCIMGSDPYGCFNPRHQNQTCNLRGVGGKALKGFKWNFWFLEETAKECLEHPALWRHGEELHCCQLQSKTEVETCLLSSTWIPRQEAERCTAARWRVAGTFLVKVFTTQSLAVQVTCTQIERSTICLCTGRGRVSVAEKAVRAVSSSGTSSAFVMFHRSPDGEQSKSKSQGVIGEI